MLKTLYRDLMTPAEARLDPNVPVNQQAEGLHYDRKYELLRDQLDLGDTPKVIRKYK